MKKMYFLVVTDDFSRFTWVFFLATKDETIDILKSFITARTPQQNGVLERINRTLIKAAKTMLADSKFWPSSGPDWLFDIDALTRIMNYELIVAGTQSNGFAGTKASDNAGQARKETKPMGMDSNPLSDDGKKVDDDSRKDSEGIDQEKEDNVNSTNNVNAAGK
ncbi:putative ribonuclease H-like domain-containing protein [Tanacetum coccineum]